MFGFGRRHRSLFHGLALSHGLGQQTDCDHSSLKKSTSAWRSGGKWERPKKRAVYISLCTIKRSLPLQDNENIISFSEKVDFAPKSSGFFVNLFVRRQTNLPSELLTRKKNTRKKLWRHNWLAGWLKRVLLFERKQLTWRHCLMSEWGIDSFTLDCIPHSLSSLTTVLSIFHSSLLETMVNKSSSSNSRQFVYLLLSLPAYYCVRIYVLYMWEYYIYRY